MSSLMMILVCLIATTQSAVIPDQVPTALISTFGQKQPRSMTFLPATAKALPVESGVKIPVSLAAVPDDRPSDMLDDVAPKVDDVAGSVVEVIENAKDKAAEIISDVKEKVADVVLDDKPSDIMDDVAPKVDDVAGAVVEVIENAKDKAAEIISDVREKVADAVDNVQDAVSDAIDKANDEVDTMHDDIDERGWSTSDDNMDVVSDNENDSVETIGSKEIDNFEDSEIEGGISKDGDALDKSVDGDSDNTGTDASSKMLSDDNDSDDNYSISSAENQSGDNDSMLETVLDIITDFNSQLKSGEVSDASIENDVSFEEYDGSVGDKSGESVEKDENRDDDNEISLRNHDDVEDKASEDEFVDDSLSWFDADNENENNDYDDDRFSQFIGKMSRAKSYMNTLDAKIAAARSMQEGTCPIYPVSVTRDRITITTKDGCNIVIRLKGVGVADINTYQDNLTDRRVQRLVEVSYHGDD